MDELARAIAMEEDARRKETNHAATRESAMGPFMDIFDELSATRERDDQPRTIRDITPKNH